MKKLDVLLVLPPTYHSGRPTDYNPKEPMGLLYLISVLRQRQISVELIDAESENLTIEALIKKIGEYQAAVIGFSVMQRALPALVKVVKALEKNKVAAHFCAGGIGATLSPREILFGLNRIDSIVLGDGEVIFPSLIEKVLRQEEWRGMRGVAYLNHAIGDVIINYPESEVDIKFLPWPNRDMIKTCFNKTGYGTIMGSRGCYGQCVFCSNCSFERVNFGSAWRGRAPRDVVDEIEYLHHEYQINVFKFNDPNLFGPGREGQAHVEQLCQELIKRNLNNLHFLAFCRSNDLTEENTKLLRRAGFERILLGIESSDPQILKDFRKGETIEEACRAMELLKAADIDLIAGFMIFNPFTTTQSLRQDLEFLKKHKIISILSKALRVFNGTVLQKILAQDKRLVWHNSLEGYHEYLIDPKIAAIYMVMKSFATEWLDRFKMFYNEEIWEIKKADSFKTRENFDRYAWLFFNLEMTLLEAVFDWTENGFRLADVISQLERFKKTFIDLESFIARYGYKRHLGVVNFSEVRMAQKIKHILTKQPYQTLPEKYRWNND
jgi:radical SAM superfamily enzyme YgiQ (UPF0313 family)